MPSPKPQDDLDLVDLVTAANPPIAEMLLAMLEDAEIPAYVKGRYLQDEFAVSQVILGRTGVVVQVPKKQLERAREVLEEANWGEDPEPLGDDDPSGDEATD